MTRQSMSLWDRFLFRDRGILPGKRLLIGMFILSLALAAAAAIWGVPWKLAAGLNIGFLLLSFADLAFLPKSSQIKLKRRVPEEMERGLPADVGIEIENHSQLPLTLRIIDDLSDSFARPFPLKRKLAGNTRGTVQYETAASIRGHYTLNRIYIRCSSFLGLWEKQMVKEAESQVKVIPDLTETRRYLENAQSYLLYEGEKIRRQQSGAGEFSKIRAYAPGDDPRKINWRQTAKLQEVMANVHEPEHGKYVTIMIDCGRIMGAELETGNRLEKALEAAMTTAAAALKNGDYVSVLAFSKDIQSYVPPSKGMQHLNFILKALYSIQADAAESNYSGAFQYLQSVQNKRSLLLLFSDVRTFTLEEGALVYLKRIRQRHLFFMLGIEDNILSARAKDRPDNIKSAMLKSMAQQQILIAKREKLRWEKQGLQMAEAPEGSLAAAAVSHYINVLNRGLL
ncbi:DUF58 domain-containing protein [Cytobacillus sp. T106]|nr:DUF58 domain-containing protein [Bacillus infantis]MDW2880004.1 DUF58 domain-containing protein [Bacillus infantis]